MTPCEDNAPQAEVLPDAAPLADPAATVSSDAAAGAATAAQQIQVELTAEDMRFLVARQQAVEFARRSLAQHHASMPPPAPAPAPEEPVVAAQSVPEPVIQMQATPDIGLAQPIPFVGQPAGVPRPPTFVSTGIVIDWIDPTQNVGVQLVRWSDFTVFDWATKAFLSEDQATNGGLGLLNRPLAGIRSPYQYVEVLTPSSVFADGAYRIFYYGAGNALLDVGCFSIHQGVPFYDGGIPATALNPSVSRLHA